jgi:hypothetical protein
MQCYIVLSCVVAVAFASSPPCLDRHTGCAGWAASGDCDSNPFFMKVQCQQSCGSCGCNLSNAATCKSAYQPSVDPMPTAPLVNPLGEGSLPGVVSPPAPPNMNDYDFTVVTEPEPTALPYLGDKGPIFVVEPVQEVTWAPEPILIIDPVPEATTVAAAATVTPVVDPLFVASECSNNKGDNNCCQWASNNECSTNPYFMKVECAKACGSCACSVSNAASCPSVVDPSCAGMLPMPTAAPNPVSPSTAVPNPVDPVTAAPYPVDPFTAPSPTVVYPAQYKNKEDELCPFWASVGECSKNPQYMLASCAKSCKSAVVVSEVVVEPPFYNNKNEENELCAFWASVGECVKNPKYMLKNCAKCCASAGLKDESSMMKPKNSGHNGKKDEKFGHGKHSHHGKRGDYGKHSHHGNKEEVVDKMVDDSPCQDKDELCAFWASVGECMKNPSYMKKSCKASCESC